MYFKKQGILKILSNYCKNKTKVGCKIKRLKNKTKHIFQILSNYFKSPTGQVPEILSNYFKPRQGIPKILGNYFKNENKRNSGDPSNHFKKQIQRGPRGSFNPLQKQKKRDLIDPFKILINSITLFYDFFKLLQKQNKRFV